MADKSENCAEKTIDGYLTSIAFFSFLKIEDFNRADLIEICKRKSSPNWTRKTLEKRLIDLSLFANWLCDNRITTRHHRVKFSRKPIARETPETHEIELIFQSLKENYLHANQVKKQLNQTRYLVTRIIYETGCRISECLNIFVEDVKITPGKYFIFIRGTKTESAERTVQISSLLFNELREFRDSFDLQGRLFSSSRGNAFNPEEFSKWLRLWCEKLGISCKIHPHLFRYLYIIESIKAGKDALEIVVRLGHSSIIQTFHYFKQVQRLYPDANLTEAISMLEKKKNLNATIYGKPKGW